MIACTSTARRCVHVYDEILLCLSHIQERTAPRRVPKFFCRNNDQPQWPSLSPPLPQHHHRQYHRYGHHHYNYYYSIYQGCVRCGTGFLGTGMDVVPNLPSCPVPVLTSYRTYRNVRYRYWRCTELTAVSGTGTKVCAGTAGTGTNVVPNLPKFPVPVLMSYRTCRSFRHRC